MRKRVIILLAVLLLSCVYAYAEPLEFGGTLQWPSFDGIPLGTNMQIALLQEEYENGNTPVLAWEDSTASVDAYVETTGGEEIEFCIGETEVCGVVCRAYLDFRENTLVCAQLRGTTTDEATALAWANTVSGQFCALYGTSRNGHAAGSDAEADISAFGRPWLWTVPYDDDPYHFDYALNEKTTLQLHPREYITTQAKLKIAEEDSGYALSASVEMAYTCAAEDTIIDTIRYALERSSEEFFPESSETGTTSTLDAAKALLGDVGKKTCDIRYRDSRYYLY